MQITLAISVGNTNTAVGVADASGWKGRFRVRTVPSRMPDDYLLVLEALLGRLGLTLSRIGAAVLSSVVPATTDRIARAIAGVGGPEPLVLGPDLDTGITVDIENPREIGADLLANAVAAHARSPASCVVVDFGTALSLTAIAAGGILRGVSIAPGLSYAVRALAQNTAQLPTVNLVAPPAAIGRNTVQSIQSGVVFGYVGMVEHLVALIRKELPGTSEVIATGGQAEVIAPLSGCFTAVEPWLTLEGLRIVATRAARRS
jgi:type III pantothenate kinase